MPKPKYATPDIDAELFEQLTALVAESPLDASVDLTKLIQEYRQKVEGELWDAWDIAQGLYINEERDRLREEQRQFREQVDHYNERVEAFRKHERQHHAAHHPDAEASDDADAAPDSGE